MMAVRTRLELATSGVTGRCSSRLNYRTAQIRDGNIYVSDAMSSSPVSGNIYREQNTGIFLYC